MIVKHYLYIESKNRLFLHSPYHLTISTDKLPIFTILHAAWNTATKHRRNEETGCPKYNLLSYLVPHDCGGIFLAVGANGTIVLIYNNYCLVVVGIGRRENWVT